LTGILTGENVPALCASSVMAGIALAALYDVFRIRRLACRRPTTENKPKLTAEDAVVFFEDLFFSLTAAALFCVLYYRFAYGAVRVYALAGALCGFLAYRYTVGQLVMKVSGIIIRAVRYAARLLYTVLIARPAKYILSRLAYPLLLRRSARLMRSGLRDAEQGFEAVRDKKQRKQWIKKRTKPKQKPTSAA